MRKRFGDALHWYGVLINDVGRVVQRALDEERDECRRGDDSDLSSAQSSSLDGPPEITSSQTTDGRSSSVDLPPSSPSFPDSEMYLGSSLPPSNIASSSRVTLENLESYLRSSSPAWSPPPSSPVDDTPSRASTPVDQDNDDANVTDEEERPNRRQRRARLRWPSEYLRRRCPVCFGGRIRGRSRLVTVVSTEVTMGLDDV